MRNYPIRILLLLSLVFLTPDANAGFLLKRQHTALHMQKTAQGMQQLTSVNTAMAHAKKELSAQMPRGLHRKKWASWCLVAGILSCIPFLGWITAIYAFIFASRSIKRKEKGLGFVIAGVTLAAFFAVLYIILIATL